MKLEYLSALQIGELVNNKEISVIEVVDYFLNRIYNRNRSLNAFVYVKADEAREYAQNLQKRIMQGENLGLFAGVPFGLKDFLPNKPGWTNSHGGVKCLIAEDNCYSEFCKAMENAGGVAIGKTNAPAYGFRGTTDNKLYGPTSTPFNVKYNSGGSSGGSAAAVADGLVPIAEGGDAGGSIRIPAAWCNLFGFKPGIGTVPSVIRPDGWSATHPFCFNFGLTKTVRDAAALLNYMGYYNPRDPFSIKRDVNYLSSIEEDIKNLKIAFTYDFDIFDIDDDVAAVVGNAVQKFKACGAEIDLVKFNFKTSRKLMEDMWCNTLMFDSVVEIEQDKAKGNDYLATYPEQFPKECIYWKNRSMQSTFWDMYNFNLVRTDILDQFENMFEKYDIIVSPTSCCLPVLNRHDGDTKGPDTIKGKAVNDSIGWAETFIVNFVGYPAASVPAGLSYNKLPVGMQIIGKKYQDENVLRVCRMFEDIQPWQNNFDIPFNRIVD